MNKGWRVAIAVTAGALASAYALLCWRLGQRLPRGVDEEPGLRDLAASLPAGFLLGTATSAHQIEGGNDGNDWARFEKEPGRIARGEVSGRADDHWNRWENDIELMRGIGAGAYRFSIEWSRVEPRQGSWDEAAWARYREEVLALRRAGIVPMVTLLHFTLPTWIADRGGVTASDFPAAFARLAAEAGRRLGDEVDLWCTLNEPNVQMYNGYVVGQFPPAMRSNEAAVRAFAGLLRAHAEAYRALRAANGKARIGLAMNVIEFEPQVRYSLLDWVATLIADDAYNWAFTDSIAKGRIRFKAPGFPTMDEAAPGLAGALDFYGLNYYRRELVHFSPGAPGMVRNGPGPGDRNDMGWEIYPAGLTRLLEEVHRRYALPIYVTENGIPDASGRKSGPFLTAHLAAAARALGRGADVRGYFYWSLLDNFEWTDGFDPRFGLYRVDYATLARTPTSGAESFAALARQLK